MNYNVKSDDAPTFYISVNGGRKKEYSDTVYLSDETEFEIELLNPTKKTYLAKISFNRTKISNSGIVLKPGERTVLKRFIDTNDKLIFSTYKTCAETCEGIEDNGFVTINFFEEITHGLSTDNLTINNNPYTYTYEYIYTPNSVYTYPINTYPYTNYYNQQYSQNYGTNNVDISINTTNTSNETGRIMKGQSSDQEFTQTNGSYSPYINHTKKIKILPESLRPKEKKDLKIYCKGCGRKSRKNDNFCSNCGNKY